MGWLGKVVGGTIGFALGGPIGAVAGAAFGHSFDRKEALYLAQEESHQQRLSTDEESQLTFFVAAFSMLAKIAKVDGRVSDKEIATIEGFMTHDLNLNPESRSSAVNIFRQALNSHESFEAFAFQFYAAFRNQPRIIELMMDVLFRVSTADGAINDKEEALLASAARTFNLSDRDYARLKSRYVKAVNRFYSVLKIDDTATNEEIKRQYRAMVSDYHPDKIEAKGLPEEFIKLANDKFIEIKEAYDAIRKERKF
ncbi:MAG: TerB family tellurite resistance protein [Desulfobacterium sp.]|nr:TerB family tellurite resistance protein [Desulfobacterium sp.]